MSKVKKFFATFAGVITLLLIKAGNVSAQALYGVPEPQDLYGVPSPRKVTPSIGGETVSIIPRVLIIIGLVILIPVIIGCGVFALIKVNSKKEPTPATETKVEENKEEKIEENN